MVITFTIKMYTNCTLNKWRLAAHLTNSNKIYNWTLKKGYKKKPYGSKEQYGKEKSRHLPIFPGRRQPSIFGTIELNFCVRHGNRWNLNVIGTGYAKSFLPLKVNLHLVTVIYSLFYDFL